MKYLSIDKHKYGAASARKFNIHTIWKYNNKVNGILNAHFLHYYLPVCFPVDS